MDLLAKLYAVKMWFESKWAKLTGWFKDLWLKLQFWK